MPAQLTHALSHVKTMCISVRKDKWNKSAMGHVFTLFVERFCKNAPKKRVKNIHSISGHILSQPFSCLLAAGQQLTQMSWVTLLDLKHCSCHIQPHFRKVKKEKMLNLTLTPQGHSGCSTLLLWTNFASVCRFLGPEQSCRVGNQDQHSSWTSNNVCVTPSTLTIYVTEIYRSTDNSQTTRNPLFHLYIHMYI